MDETRFSIGVLLRVSASGLYGGVVETMGLGSVAFQSTREKWRVDLSRVHVDVDVDRAVVAEVEAAKVDVDEDDGTIEACVGVL